MKQFHISTDLTDRYHDKMSARKLKPFSFAASISAADPPRIYPNNFLDMSPAAQFADSCSARRGAYITFLMETTKASEIPLSGGHSLSLRPVTADDEEFLLSVYAGTRDAELSQVLWEEGQREAFVKWQFEMQRREYDARFPDAEYNVVMVDGQRAGRIWIGRDDEQIRLLDIALLPEFQNRGAGKVLLQRLIDESARSGKALRHMVFVLNNNADRFYERLGFVMIEEFGAYKHMEWRPGNK